MDVQVRKRVPSGVRFLFSERVLIRAFSREIPTTYLKKTKTKTLPAEGRKNQKQAGYVPIPSPLQIEAKTTTSRDMISWSFHISGGERTLTQHHFRESSV
jgi:hypothetical protein